MTRFYLEIQMGQRLIHDSMLASNEDLRLNPWLYGEVLQDLTDELDKTLKRRDQAFQYISSP